MEKKNILSKALETLFGYELFRITALVLVMLRSCALLNPIVGPFVKLTIVWAVLILLKDLFTNRLLLVNRYRLILYLFMIAYGVTTLLNRSENFARNVAILGYLAVSMLVMYAYDPKREEGKVKGELVRFGHAFLITAFVGQFISLVSFFLNINFSYQVDGYLYYYGVVSGRLWGFFANPNSGSLYALLCLMFTILCLVIRKGSVSRLWKIFYGFNMVVQALVFFLCNSRTNLFIACVFIVLYFLFTELPTVVEHWKSKKERGTRLRRMAILCVVAPLALLGTYEYAIDILPNFVIQDSTLSNQLTEELDARISGTVSVISGVEDSTDLERDNFGTRIGGRYYLWQSGVEIVKNFPLFGVGNENVENYAYRYASRYFTDFGDSVYLPGISGGGMHNLFFQIASASGLVGLGIFVVFLLMLLIRAARYYIWMIKSRKVNPISVVCLCMLLAILLRTMMDTGIVYGLLEQGVVFWTLLSGFMYFMDTEYTAGRKPIGAVLFSR